MDTVAMWIGYAFMLAVGVWLVLLGFDVAFMLIAHFWRPFISIGRLALYFDAASGPGQVTSFTTSGNRTFRHKFWYFFWQV